MTGQPIYGYETDLKRSDQYESGIYHGGVPGGHLVRKGRNIKGKAESQSRRLSLFLFSGYAFALAISASVKYDLSALLEGYDRGRRKHAIGDSQGIFSLDGDHLITSEIKIGDQNACGVF